MYRYGADVCPKSAEFHAGPICCVVSLRVFRTLRACKILICPVSHGIFALAQDGAKFTYLKDILHNLQCSEPLTETSTNRKTFKEHKNNQP